MNTVYVTNSDLSLTVNFTHHAFIRVEERISLNIKEISQILKWEKFISIGMEKKTNREHRLFYSHSDSQCFVLIQDIKTNTVITILPLDYHERISWAVSLELQKEAKELILGKSEAKELNLGKSKVDQDKNHKFFIVFCDVLDGYCNFVKKIKLSKFEACDYDHDINKMIVSDVFINDILENINLIIKDTTNHVDEIIIKKKSKDIAPTFIQLEDYKKVKLMDKEYVTFRLSSSSKCNTC